MHGFNSRRRALLTPYFPDLGDLIVDVEWAGFPPRTHLPASALRINRLWLALRLKLCACPTSLGCRCSNPVCRISLTSFDSTLGRFTHLRALARRRLRPRRSEAVVFSVLLCSSRFWNNMVPHARPPPETTQSFRPLGLPPRISKTPRGSMAPIPPAQRL